MRRTAFILLSPALLVAFLLGSVPASAGGGCFGPVSQGTGSKVDLTRICFSPTVLYVRPGDTVTWTNQDSFDHLVTGANLLWSSDGMLHAGQSLSYQFLTPGVYPYTCALHHGMSGAVIVGDGKMPGAPVINLASTAAPTATAAATGREPLAVLFLLALATGGAGFAIGRFVRRPRATDATAR